MAAVIVNHRITTPVTIQLRLSKGRTNLNVLKAHIISSPPWNYWSSTQIYYIPKWNRWQHRLFLILSIGIHIQVQKILQRSKTSRVYISHKIESAIPFGEIKYGNRQRLSNIFDILVTNNAYLNLNTFCTRKEHSVGLFAHINPKITLRDNFRNEIQNDFMWIDLDNEESLFFPSLSDE